MNGELITVRRATLEDIGPLTALWESMRFNPDALAKRITEFQIAELQGSFIGAVGLQILDKQGLIHSEGFTDFAYAEHARTALWDRMNALASNYGLLRLWTQERAPFWSHCGMTKADRDSLEKLPPPWKLSPGDWLTAKLRDDLDTLVAADREFALFMQAEKARTARALQRAKILKTIAGLIALIVMGLAMTAAFFVLQRSQILRRKP